MARPKKTPPATLDEAVKPQSPHEDLPVLESLGIAHSPKGWVVFKLTTQGHTILDKELLSEPLAKTYAQEQLKIAVVKTFILPRNSQIQEIL